MPYRNSDSPFETNERPAISLSQRVTFQQLDAEVWRIYFNFVKASLTILTSILYFAVLILFVIVQQAAYAAAQFTQWVSNWNSEKPAVFQASQMEAEESYEDRSHAHHVEAI